MEEGRKGGREGGIRMFRGRSTAQTWSIREGVNEEVRLQPGRRFVIQWIHVTSGNFQRTRQSQKETDLRVSPESRLVAVNPGETDGDKWMSWGHQNRAFPGSK